MKSILEELFYGNVCPGTDFRSKDAKTRKLMEHLTDYHESLSGTLTDKPKELLEKFDDCYCCYAIIIYLLRALLRNRAYECFGSPFCCFKYC